MQKSVFSHLSAQWSANVTQRSANVRSGYRVTKLIFALGCVVLSINMMFNHLTFNELVQICDDYLVNLAYEYTYLPSHLDALLELSVSGGDMFLYELYLLFMKYNTSLDEAKEHFNHLDVMLQSLVAER